jgi:RNA polymerase sigma-70 factor (ECF subfamily)
VAQDPEFQELMERLRGGDQAAAAEIFRRFAHRLIALARGHLDDKIRSKLDPEDVVQSVFRSFFIRFAADRFELENWDGLWALLTCVTLRKCGFQVRHYHADCRDAWREAAPEADREGPGTCWEAIAREPTPFEAAVLVETVQHTFQGLSERDRVIVELALTGHSRAEIGSQARTADRTVYRVLERVKGKLERLAGE